MTDKRETGKQTLSESMDFELDERMYQ